LARRKVSIQCPEKPPEIDRKDLYNLTCRVDVITPLFGGGVEPGRNDPCLQTIVRGTSVRGHLRFWWRATRGARYENPAELFGREAEIWGSTDNPSPVVIQTEIIRPGRAEVCARHQGAKVIFEKGYPSYALFPFQGKPKENIPPEKARVAVSFQLFMHVPDKDEMAVRLKGYNKKRDELNLPPLSEDQNDISSDVNAALWAWINFGGIGARTRRGCGALYCRDMACPSRESFTDWVNDARTKYDFQLIDGNRPWPTFPHAFFIKRGFRTPTDAWNDVIRRLRHFRQGSGVGRDPDTGRSLWPEAESVREIYKRPSPNKHKPEPERIPTQYFPRAEFGMPIILELRNEGLKPTLQFNKKTDRLGSPLILRPIKCVDGEIISIIALLNTERLKSAFLKTSDAKDRNNEPIGENIDGRHIRSSCLATYANSPMGKSSKEVELSLPSDSALRAFLAFVKGRKSDRDEDYSEVIL
jgi:CRISPR-associated protein Cmr1